MQSHQDGGLYDQMVIPLVTLIDTATLINKLRANKKPLNHGNDLTADVKKLLTRLYHIVSEKGD